MRTNLIAIIALTTTALVPVGATAQQNQTPPNHNQPAQTSEQEQVERQQGVQQNLTPQRFLHQAAISNQFEIESSRHAQENARNERVRKFAQRMIRDHSAAGEKLKQAAKSVSGKVISLPKGLDDEHRQKLIRLRGMTGQRLDRTYVRMQVEAHEQAVSLFERVIQMDGPTPLRQFAEKTLPTLKEHEEAIRQIQDDVFPGAPTARAGDNRSDIVIRRTPPNISVDQGAPRVTVQQAQPEITVQQGRPEITVLQPRPTITVDIPQPQITIRMPKPNVNVSQAKPEVSVQRPQPRVRVEQSDQNAKVQLEREEAQVNIQREEQQANVDVQAADGAPLVRYEREEPRVVINRAQGQPTVRYERAGDQQQAQQNRQDQAQQQQQARGAATQAELERARQRLSDGDDADDAASAAASADTDVRRHQFRVTQIEGMEVQNARGEDLGEVDAVVQTRDGNKFVVVANGGFFGLGEDKVVFPEVRFWIRGDRLVIRGVTEDDIENMADYRDHGRNYTDVNNNVTMSIPEWL